MNRRRKRSVGIFVMLCAVLAVSLSACSFPRTLSSARARAYRDHQRYTEAFEEVTNITVRSGPSILGFNNIHYYDVPEELAEAGIDSVYKDKNAGVIYFEYSDQIMYLTPYGLVYAVDTAGIPDWYELDHIEGDWYIFRITS